MATAEALPAQTVTRPDGAARKPAHESAAVAGGPSFAEILGGATTSEAELDVTAPAVAPAVGPPPAFNAATQLALLARLGDAGPVTVTPQATAANASAAPVEPLLPVPSTALAVAPVSTTDIATPEAAAATGAATAMPKNASTAAAIPAADGTTDPASMPPEAASPTPGAAESEASVAPTTAAATKPAVQTIETAVVAAATAAAAAETVAAAPATPRAVATPETRAAASKATVAAATGLASAASSTLPQPDMAKPSEAPTAPPPPLTPSRPTALPDSLESAEARAQQGAPQTPAQAKPAATANGTMPAEFKPDAAQPSGNASASFADSMAAARTTMAAPMPPATIQAANLHSAPPALQTAPPVAVQVYTRFVERFDGRAQRFEISLQPAELGRVDVRIEIGADRKVHAILAAHDSNALGDLMRGQRALERALSEAGIDLAKDGLKFELSQDSGRNAAGWQRGDASAERELAQAWRAFTTVDVPVEASPNETATVMRPYSRASRLDLVA